MITPYFRWERLGTHVEGALSFGVYFSISWVIPRSRDWAQV